LHHHRHLSGWPPSNCICARKRGRQCRALPSNRIHDRATSSAHLHNSVVPLSLPFSPGPFVVRCFSQITFLYVLFCIIRCSSPQTLSASFCGDGHSLYNLAG